MHSSTWHAGTSTTVSTSFSRHSAAFSFMSSGMSVTSNLAPSDSSFQTIAFIWTRSTTPLKSDSVPIGSWSTAGVAPSCSMIVLTQK